MSGGVQFADRFGQNSRTPTAPEVSNVLDLAVHRRQLVLCAEQRAAAQR
ncbi:hypothetical protein [Nocardia cyriacigeorgica]|nr:hypothetical protein [Nocardia cyriacigeorgica]